jgi:pyrroline-5-carboxylate reductase
VPRATSKTKLGFLGGGAMAEALIRGLLAQEQFWPDDILVSDVSAERREYLQTQFGVHVTAQNQAVAKAAPTVILAVKPGLVPAVLQECRAALNAKLVISIAAGVSTAKMRSHASARFVRVMPNTPALVNAGMSVYHAASDTKAADKTQTRDIFAAVGRVAEVAQEDLLDAVTGLSGSGPAYVFLFLEALADGGVKAGLPRALAMELAAQTVMGAARLQMETGKHPGELKDMVTSPNGTTIEGIGALERAGFRSAVIEAVQAAARRSKELGKG